MSQILYLECYSGISGFEAIISRVKKAGLDVCDFQVILDHDNHDHDMAYLHGDHQ